MYFKLLMMTSECHLVFKAICLNIKVQGSLTIKLSDLSLANSLFPKKVRFWLPNLANLLGALTRVCINILFVSTPQNVDFAH